MGVTYVSRIYGGKASDQYITSNSADLLENLETSKGSIMTDRGFLVHGILSDMGVKVHMPAFKGTDRCQFTASEAEQSEMISKVRIHVERVIQRIKTYHIFDTELKLTMKDIAAQVFTVCAFHHTDIQELLFKSLIIFLIIILSRDVIVCSVSRKLQGETKH